MKRVQAFILSLVILGISLEGFGQDIVSDKLLENINDWHEGRVFLTDGRELTGLVRFDDHTGILSFQDGDNSKALIAKSAAGFEVFGDGETRTFISMQYDDRNGTPKYYFFELLKDCKSFMVLSRVDPIEVETKSSGGSGPFVDPVTGRMSGGFPGSQYTEVRQTETVFIMDTHGKLQPYVRIVERETDRLFSRKRTKNKFIDESVLIRYTGRHYADVEAYAIKNDLSFRVKGDLLQVLDYYMELRD